MNSSNFDSICFEGGGVKGISYIGALKILNKYQSLDLIKNYAATSVGSIFAAILSCGATMNFIEKEFDELNLANFEDGGYWGLWRLWNNYGYCKGNYIYDWIGKIIEKLTGNPNITFANIYEKFDKNLNITGTCINKKPNERIFNRETTPNLPIRDAVRASTSIFIVFEPFTIKNSEGFDEIYQDGGDLNNFPIEILGNDANILGLYIGKENEKNIEITNLKNYLCATLSMLLNTSNYKKPVDKKEVCFIDVEGINSIDFNISAEQKQYLKKCGEIAMEKYLENKN